MGTLWFGGTIYTMGAENETVKAIFTENGIIRDAGKCEELEEIYKEMIDDRVDLGAAVLYPGFTDSHIHLIGHGEKLIRIDFSKMTCHEEILKAIKEKAENAEPGEWIIGEGWNENQLKEGHMFDRHILDAEFPDQPILLKRICRHALLASTAALKLAGITDLTEDPPGGIVKKDDEGKLTGFLMDRAMDPVYEAAPEVTEAYMKRALRLAVEDCRRKGITGVHTEDLSYYIGLKETLNVFQKVITKDNPLKTHLLVHHSVIEELEEWNPSFAAPYLETGAMKVFADGALGGRTALLSEPYEDAPDETGVAVHPQDELSELVKMARQYGREAAIHAIGDKGFEYALNAIEAFPPLPGQRDRIIHAQILRADLIERAKNLPLILDIQPGFTASDFPWVIERLGEERMKYSFAWKTLLENGLICAGGSDAPIEELSPLIGIHAAVARKSIHTPDREGYYLDEALSVYEAVRLYTYGSAQAIKKEHCRGLVKKGYEADFTVLDRDLFSVPHDEIKKANTVMTVIDGKIVYRT
ncbi:amidohydrolase [Metabacillus sp. GX 13764]|uniref:amidohydrolase n=1 Tax=Metabacillus kandeliae TaxID=2900151 RepID=UPI001E318215|nr:amidohydrolase [Metabacillus kandeliae]MCD7032756.1 amidohydrolase [Metabacillus kandeliae]